MTDQNQTPPRTDPPPIEEQFLLFTRTRKPIPNHQRVTPITTAEINMFEGLTVRRHPNETYRPIFDPMYNCHGLTFASRRTQISHTADVIHVLREDGYRLIKATDVLPGDVIVYWEDDGEISHTGIVVEVRDGMTRSFRIWSKWSAFGKEVVHWADQCPYAGCHRMGFYRLSPIEGGQEWSKAILIQS